MYNSGNRQRRRNGGKRKHIPLFGIAIGASFTVITAILWVNAMRDAPGRVSPPPPTISAPGQIFITPSPNTIVTGQGRQEASQEAPDNTPLPPAIAVKGIYYNVYFWQDYALRRCIELIETTDLNTIVIDVKEDHGLYVFHTDNELLTNARDVFRSNFQGEPIPNETIADLNERGIYTIARVVCFKDDLYVGVNPNHALQDINGGPWRDREGTRWINPYNKDSWEYIAQVCREAAKLGFDEIQLDYVRFPTEGLLSRIDYGQAAEEQSKYQVINEFVSYIRNEMVKEGVRTSADIFGGVGISYIDASDVGQNVGLLLGSLDSICPMIYPSHFTHVGQNGEGSYINGILFERPDLQPYEVVYNVLQHYNRHLEEFNEANPGVQPAVVRPYLQYFTADWIGEEYYLSYGPEETHAQINAVNDAGFEEWILWRGYSNNYYAELIP